jgi:hypothetical protein
MEVRFPINDALYRLTESEQFETSEPSRPSGPAHFQSFKKPSLKYWLNHKHYLTNYLVEYFN